MVPKPLREKCVAIINKMEDHVLQAPTRVVGSDDEIKHVGMMYTHLLTSLDEYFSCLRTKRFHLAPKILEKGKHVPQPSLGS
jgi:hypothetical protein